MNNIINKMIKKKAFTKKFIVNKAIVILIIAEK
jgi:hypothetical protein